MKQTKETDADVDSARAVVSVSSTSGGMEDVQDVPSGDSVMGASTSKMTSSVTTLTLDSMKRSSASDLIFSKRSSGLSEEAAALKPAEFLESKHKSERMFPCSRLRFSNLELVGRDNEKEMLTSCLRRLTPGKDQTGASRELVLISGYPGTGKTALASSLAKSVNILEGLYVKGKFDLYLRDEPYSGISAACREICGRILLMRGSESFDKIRAEVIDKLGSENLCRLISIIPELAEVVGDDLNMENMTKQHKQGGGETKARFNYAFRVFIRVVASHFAPLVVLLDDIQWADAATLDLLQVLIADRENASLMMIGVYRSNEVDEVHLLSPLIRDLKRTAEQDDFNVTEIEIGNLYTSQINEVIMVLLSIEEPAKTLGLANICLKRTHGNIFSLLVFLEMLQTQGLLQYSLGRFEWGWDEQRILSKSAATSNVVDLMKQKIERLPPSVWQRLSIAACLGFSFEPAILNTVWTIISEQRNSTETSETGEDDDIDAFLALVEQEGFLEIEPDSTTAYRWVHDKVQEAAISLVPPDELPSLKALVGKILVKELDDKILQSYIFTVVNLLHEGVHPEEEPERIQLAELSLRASKMASGQSAFDSAGKYATIGVSILPANKWSNHYELTLDLYSTAAEAASYLGKINLLEMYYREIIDQTNRPLFDKLRVYQVMISYMGNALGRPNDAIELIVRILAQYGVRFPKRKPARLLSTMSGLLKAKRKMSSLQPEDISNLPMMSDPLYLQMMRLLDQLFLAAYLAESDLMPLSIIASIQLTLENGLSEYSAPSFACLALLLGVALGDMTIASKTGTFSRLAMSIVECKNMDARAELWLCGFVFCWSEPVTALPSRLLKAYETGLSVGDTENACWCIGNYLDMSLQLKPLETVEADCKIYMKQMSEFKRETCHADTCIYFETARNLMGRTSGDPTVMEHEKRWLSHSDHTVLGIFYSCRSILYLYFGEYEKGAKLAIERGNAYSKGVPGHWRIMVETFTRGMLLYGMARMTRKRIYKYHAKKVHKTIQSWVRKGNPNVKHYNLLLNAESAALDRNLDAAERFYRDAFVSASRRGSVNESALASERYGEFLLYERSDPEEARYKLEGALQLYEEWGAARKVAILRKKHEDLWQKPTEFMVGPLER